jgi:predicted aconitase with swiveling domain
MEIRAHMVSAGKAEGKAIVYAGSFSFMGDLDPLTGRICAPRHPLENVNLVDKIFVFTTGKGSSAGDCAAWNAKENGNAPAAIICLESEPVLSGAVIISGIPTVDRPEKNVFALIETGDFVKVDATLGIITVIKTRDTKKP